MHMRRLAWLSVPALAAATLATAQSGLFDRSRGGAEEPLATVRLVSEHARVSPGGETTLAILMDLRDGWHTYWQNPGDSGMPVQVSFDAPEGVEIGSLQWPAPTRYLYSGGIALDYVYHDTATLLASVRVPETVHPGETILIRADVSYLVCDDVCIPGESTVELLLEIAEPETAGGLTPDAEAIETARARVPRELSNQDDEGIFVQWIGRTLVLEARGAEGVQYFPLAPALPAPENAIGDCETDLDTLTVLYPWEILDADRVRGVLSASIQGQTRVYTIDIGPPTRD